MELNHHKSCQTLYTNLILMQQGRQSFNIESDLGVNVWSDFGVKVWNYVEKVIVLIFSICHSPLYAE